MTEQCMMDDGTSTIFQDLLVETTTDFLKIVIVLVVHEKVSVMSDDGLFEE